MKRKIFLSVTISFILLFLLAIVISANTVEVGTESDFVTAIKDNTVDKIVLTDNIEGTFKIDITRSASIYIDFAEHTINARDNFITSLRGSTEETIITFANGTLITGNDAITINAGVTFIFDKMTFNPGYDGIYAVDNGYIVNVEFNNSTLEGSSRNSTSLLNAKGAISYANLSAKDSVFNFNNAGEGAILKLQNNSSSATLRLEDCNENSDAKHYIVLAAGSIVNAEIINGKFYGLYDARVDSSSLNLTNVFLATFNALGLGYTNMHPVNGHFCVVGKNGEHIEVNAIEKALEVNNESTYDLDGDLLKLSTLTTTLTYESGFDNVGKKKDICPVCGNIDESETSKIFTFKGYSVSNEGDAIIGAYMINEEALEQYNLINNTNLHYGTLFVNTKDVTDEGLVFDSGVIEYEGKAIQAEFVNTDYKYDAFNFKMKNLNLEEHGSITLIISMYVWDGENISFVQGDSNVYEENSVNVKDSDKVLKVVTLGTLYEASKK